MTVRQLIEKLEYMPQYKEVHIYTDGDERNVSDVWESPESGNEEPVVKIG